MRYSALHGLSDFYRKSEGEVYIDRSRLTPEQLNILTDDQLAQVVAEGVRLSDAIEASIRASQGPGAMDYVVAWCWLAVAAVAAVAGGAGAAAGGGGSGSGAGAGAGAGAGSGAGGGAGGGTAAGTGAGTGGSSGGWSLAEVQEVASYVATADQVRVAATGDEPSDLGKVANVVASPDAATAIEKGFKYKMAEEGAELNEKDKAAKSALRELIKREQEEYANMLREQAIRKSEQRGMPPPPEVMPKEPTRWPELLAVATPFLMALLS